MAVDKITEQYLNLYNSMTPEERSITGAITPASIIGMSKDEIKFALVKLENCTIKSSQKKRSDELTKQSEQSEKRWLNTREKYYKASYAIPINIDDENYAKFKKAADDIFFELKLAADRMLSDKIRAYNASIWEL